MWHHIPLQTFSYIFQVFLSLPIEFAKLSMTSFFCCPQIMAKREVAHGHLTIIWSAFYAINFSLVFPDSSTEGELQSERQGTEKAYLSRLRKENDFSFYASLLPLSTASSRASTGLTPHPNFIQLIVLESVVCSNKRSSFAVTQHHTLDC